jgi:hypothetical protein
MTKIYRDNKFDVKNNIKYTKKINIITGWEWLFMFLITLFFSNYLCSRKNIN